MFNKLTNSWELIKASAKVLGQDKELIIFPIISAIGTLLVTATFFIPLFLADVFDTMFSRDLGIVPFIVGLAFYLVQYTVIFFANTALVGAALIRLRGGDPTIGDGFRIAFQRIGSILGYALIAATVGMILRTIQEKAKGNALVRTVIGLLGFAWNVATFLVVPVLAVEGIGPLQAIKRSVSLLKKTWGEQIVGNFGIGAVFGLINLGVILLGAGGIFVAVKLESIVLGVIVVALVVLLLLALGLISSALNGIYTAAVYQYAVSGQTSGMFATEMVQGAFRQK
jgi:hypothetical protein